MATRIVSSAIVEYTDVNGNPRTALQEALISPSPASEVRLERFSAVAPIAATVASVKAERQTIADEYTKWKSGKGPEPVWLAAAIKSRKGATGL